MLCMVQWYIDFTDTLRECLYWLTGTNTLLTAARGKRLQAPVNPLIQWGFSYAGLDPKCVADNHLFAAWSQTPSFTEFNLYCHFCCQGYAIEACNLYIRSRLLGRHRTERLGWVAHSCSLPADFPPVIHQYHCCTETEGVMWKVCDVSVCTLCCTTISVFSLFCVCVWLRVKMTQSGSWLFAVILQVEKTHEWWQHVTLPTK